jgi:hypothetical protein
VVKLGPSNGIVRIKDVLAARRAAAQLPDLRDLICGIHGKGIGVEISDLLPQGGFALLEVLDASVPDIRAVFGPEIAW